MLDVSDEPGYVSERFLRKGMKEQPGFPLFIGKCESNEH